MAVPFTINTVWEVGGWLFWHLLLVGGGLVLAAIRSYKLTKLLWGWPSGAPNRFFYHFLWLVIAVQWTASAFIIYWSPDPLAPTTPGTWDLWFLPLAFGAAMPVVAFLFHLIWWIFYGWTAGFVILIVLFVWNVAVLVLYIVLAPGSLIAGLLHIVSLVILFYLIVIMYFVMRCNRRVDVPQVWFCDTIVPRPGACPVTPRDSLLAAVQSSEAPIGSDLEAQQGGRWSVVKRAPISARVGTGDEHSSVFNHSSRSEGAFTMAHQDLNTQIESAYGSRRSKKR